MLSGMRGVVIISVLAGAMGGFAASAILGKAGVSGQPDATMFQVVRAKEFELIDVQGRTRGKIGFSADAQPYLQLRDENDLSGVWIATCHSAGLPRVIRIFWPIDFDGAGFVVAIDDADFAEVSAGESSRKNHMCTALATTSSAGT